MIDNIQDAAYWGVLFDAGILGTRISSGSQKKFNWAELGGAAVSGAVCYKG